MFCVLFNDCLRFGPAKMRVLQVTALLALCVFVECFSSVSSQSFQCARYCKEASRAGYQPHKSYTYEYSGRVRTFINTLGNAEEIEDAQRGNADETGLLINCTLQIQAVSQCDYVLHITQASITDYHVQNTIRTENYDKFRQLEDALIYLPTHFAYNGKIDTICHDKSESKQVLDIKRAILSVFQNSNADFKPELLVYESDITGNCETHYRVQDTPSGKLVQKTKNLRACDHRMSHYLSWQTVPYQTSNVNAKSLPLLRSTLKCDMKYDQVLKECKCLETHVFQPFSNGDNSALTHVTQSLKLIQISDQYTPLNNAIISDVQRSSLWYVNDHESRQSESIHVALENLRKLEHLTADGVDGNVPAIFGQLVYEFQILPYQRLIEIYERIHTNPKQKRFFIDAISLLQTTSGIEVMQELYENSKINEAQMNSWLTSLNFMSEPTRKTLQVVIPLTYHKEIQKNAILAFSSMLYKYCSKHNCLEDMVVLEMVKILEKPLNANGCVPTSEEHKSSILLALKAIGNAGITTSFYNLQSCYLNDELAIELRLAAIAAHRRMRCAENENLDDFRDLFADSRTNSEVRIAAYLASMQCASYALFTQVKDVLYLEEANQVGSFIWTHITNLQETSVPWKSGLRKLVENEFLKNKYNTDIRKYSRNYEASKFFDSMGVGAGVEANVIFSTESFLPRSAMLNFTLDLFGESINVLELGGRAEGFEQIVEKLVGYEQEYEHNGENHDGQAKQQLIDQFGEKFQMLPKQPKASLYAKIFGNEINYKEFDNFNIDNLNSQESGTSSSSSIIYNMLKSIIKKQDIDYTKSIKFIDANYKIPTILGFPLQLKANGTATMGLTASGEMNLQDLWQYKMLVKGKIYPSVAVQVACTMSIDSYRGESGIQYVSKMNSNTYIDGYANIHLGKIVDVKINVPKKQMDIFSMSSNIYIVHPEGSYAMQDVTSNVDSAEFCTDEYITRKTGLQFCNQWRYVNASILPTSPSFPLTGMFKYSTHLKKMDTFEYYHLFVETKLGEPSKPEEYLVSLIIDTPNSQIDRKLEAYLMMNTKNYAIESRVHSPFVKFALKSNIEQEEKKFKFHFLTHFNEKELITLHSVFDIRHVGEVTVYEPHAKVNYMKQQIAALSGTLNHIQGGDYVADLRLEGLLQDVVQINGNFSCAPHYLSLNTDIQSKAFKGNFEGMLSVKTNEMSAKSRLKYHHKNTKEETAEFNALFHRGIRKHNVELSLGTSQWSRYNTKFHWDNEYGQRYFNNSADLLLFETQWTTQQIVKLNDLQNNMIILGELSCPQKAINYKTELSYLITKKLLKARILAQLNLVQRVETFLRLISREISDEAHFIVYYPTETWTLDGTRNKTSHDSYQFSMIAKHSARLKAKPSVLVTIDGSYKNSSMGEFKNHRINVTLDLPDINGWHTPWLISGTLQHSETMFLGSCKVNSKEDDFSAHLNWIGDSLALSMQVNDKPIFVVNGLRTEEVINAVLALNIYQHYELRFNLVRPYQKFALELFWDKERDPTRRLHFGIESNTFKGEYHMDIEYPNQKIGANMVLLPSQVVMNITWGVKVSQKIYLKVGSKYYDVGGLYFGQLETPFKYLEKQQFNLKYYVVSDSFDVQSDISWREHNINLLISGSKSNTHLMGNLQLNTTLEEIRKVGAAISHTSDDMSFKSDAAFDYNEHSIRAAANCHIDDIINGDFIIESPTGTIVPILGKLQMNNDDGKNMLFTLNWQDKNITTSYSFKSDRSKIEMHTPFEGIEHSLLQYSVINDAQTVYLDATVALFKHNNSLTLSWSEASEEFTIFWVDVTSPVTGHYYMFATHSQQQGMLNENVRIEGPDQRDILRMYVRGDIIPSSIINVTAGLKLLDHDASVQLSHMHSPLQRTNFIAVWNERTVNSRMWFNFVDAQLQYFQWQIESNLFAPIHLHYHDTDKLMNVELQLPNDYHVRLNAHNNGTFAVFMHASMLTFDLDNKFVERGWIQTINAQNGDQKVRYTFETNWRQDSNYKEINTNITYNFYEDSVVTHSYNITGFVRKNPKVEQIALEVESTSNLQGHFVVERKIGQQLIDNSLEVNCEFKEFCNLIFLANKDFTFWNDKSSDKFIKLNYEVTTNQLDIKLVSTYERLANATFLMNFDKVEALLTVENHKFEVKSDPFNMKLVHSRSGQELLSAFLHFQVIGFGTLGFSSWKGYSANIQYQTTGSQFGIDVSGSWPGNNISFTSEFTLVRILVGQVQLAFNDALYSTTFACEPLRSLDMQITTPEDTIKGSFQMQNSIMNQTFELQLSTTNSSNFVLCKKYMENVKCSAIADYLKIPYQELAFDWNSLSGNGTYIDGNKNKHTFTLSTPGFTQWAFNYYLPNGTLLLNINANGRFESSKDFEFALDGMWRGQKVKLDLKNYFGSYYQTTFILLTPLKGWTRTSLDCTLNDRKIGLQLVARNKHMSLIARRNLGELLSIEYQGETLLEVSSREGFMTLRTTNYFGNYRLFIQSTQTPGIYVFSILKNGENVVSFMLQNYSTNGVVLHYKGKLMAPEILPHNATLNIEFKVHTNVWQLLDFKLKKNNKPFLQLGWENTKRHNGFEGLYVFQSSVPFLPNFMVNPSISANGAGVVANVKYPCQRVGKCFFDLVINTKGLVIVSRAPIDELSFDCESAFKKTEDSIESVFELNNAQQENIFKYKLKMETYKTIDFWANVKGQEVILTMDIPSRKAHLEVVTLGYLKLNSHHNQLLLDAFMPQKTSIKGSFGLSTGYLAINGVDKYNAHWTVSKTDNKTVITAGMKYNDQPMGNITYHYQFDKEYNADLHISYNESRIDAVVNGIYLPFHAYKTGDIRGRFSLFSNIEQLRNVSMGSVLKHTKEAMNIEQYFRLDQDEFVLNASITTNEFDEHIMSVYCKPFKNTVLPELITAKGEKTKTQDGKNCYKFDLTIDDEKYVVNALPYINGYEIFAMKENSDDKILQAITITSDSLYVRAQHLGMLKDALIRINKHEFFVSMHINESKQVFFLHNGAFGIIASPETMIIAKIGGMPFEVEYDSDLINDSREIMIVGAYDNSRLKFALDYDKIFNGTLIVNNYKAEAFENGHSYNLICNDNSGKPEQLIFYKDWSKISNTIYFPVEVNIEKNAFILNTPNATMKITNTSLYLQHPEIHLDISKKQVIIETEQQRLKVLLTGNRFKLTLNHLLLLEYEIQHGFKSNLMYSQGNQNMTCELHAKTLGDITFMAKRNEDLVMNLKSWYNSSSIAYQLQIPEWDILQLFDIALAWNMTKDFKHFTNRLNVKSFYTGDISTQTKFHFEYELLDIRAYFKAPFLTGFEYFNSTIYIPKEFRPFIEIETPKDLYKLYFDYSEKHIDTGIIYNKEKFLLNYRKSQDYFLNITIPDERVKHVFFNYDHRYQLFVLKVDGFWIKSSGDYPHIEVGTPYKGYERFGFLFKCLNREFKFVVFHPAFADPLGIVYKNSYKNSILKWFYSIHSPFTINGYNFAVANFTSNVTDANKFNLKLETLTNLINNTLHIAYQMNEDQKVVSLRHSYNGYSKVFHLGFDPTNVLLAVGGCISCEEDLTSWLNGNNNETRYLSDELHIVQVSLREKIFRFALHDKMAPIVVERRGNEYFKFIWDFRSPKKNVIGVILHGSHTLDIHVADNLIKLQRIKLTPHNYTLSAQFNKKCIEYKYCKQNRDTTQTLSTPFGEMVLRQAPRHTSWFYKGAKESLSITNDLIGNGTFISRVESSFLKHDVILNVTFSNTIIDSVLIYSAEPEKQLTFKMSYAKNNANGQNLTSRLFVLRHPASMIDYELSLSTMRSPEMSNGSVTFKYKDYEANNASHEIHGFLRVDHPISKRFGVHVEVGTHRNRFNMMATSTSSAQHQGFLMNVAINDKDPLNIECTYSFKPESPSVSLMAAYGNSRKYVLYAGLPNEKEVMLKLGHEIYGKASLDALAVAKLNTTQLLWMKMMWKNNLYAPFHEAVLEEYKDLRFVVEAIGQELIDSVHDDVGKQLMNDVKTIKLEVVKRTIQEFSEQWLPNKNHTCTNTICKYLYDNERSEEVRHFVDNQLQLIYDSTRKFLEATWTSIEQLCNSIVKEVDIVLNDIKNIQRIKIDCKGLLREGINTARRQLKAMEDTAVRLLDELDRYIAHVRSEIEKFFDPLLNLIDDFIAYVEHRLTIFQIAILDALDNVQKYIFDLREIKALYSMYHTYINWLEELHVVNMLEPLGDMIEQILETIIADVRLLAAHYRPYLDAMGDALFGKYDGLQQLPPIVEMREHVNRIYHKTVWMWNYHNMTETLKQCVKKLSRDVDNALSFIEFDNMNIASAADDMDSDYSLFGYNYVLQPENRLIEISQPLPVEWEAFDKSPSFEHYPLYQKILGKSEQFIRFHKSRYELIDALENVVVDLYEPNIAPATQNLAMTVDDAHYATFNGMHYGFRAANCAFLLATDFRSKSFSLIANYKANGRRTYEVLADGAAFEIFNESNVTMNGQPMDLPVMHKQLVITRQERSISVESRDFKMTCYFHYEYCTVQLSGWLFGKTAGLLGTLDNERYTDAMTSSRQLGNITEFIQSWQVDGTGQCEFQVLQESATTNEDYSNYACYLLFDDAASPLSECYHKVPPKPYRTMCNHELENPTSGKICSSVAAYVHKCRRAKVSIEMPEICVTCNEDFGYKEEIFDGHNNKTIDVVFINELDCHNNSLPLAETLDNTLFAKGFTNNRFANIGYGGKILPKPHIYTHHGQIWSKSSDLVPTRHLAGRVAHKNKFTAIDAIQYAANLEYRVGVSKLFILAQCEVAKDLSNSPEVYNMLGEKDVTLHLLKPHAFKRKDVVGVSLTAAVPTATDDLQNVLNAIDDVYAGLALSTNGTLFDIDKLHVSNVSEWARTVTANVRRSPCQKCKCVPNSDAVGRIQCTRCLAPAVKQFLNEYEEGNKMKFNDYEDGYEAEADGGPGGNQ